MTAPRHPTRCPACGAHVHAIQMSGPFKPGQRPPEPVYRWSYACDRGHVVAPLPEQPSLFDAAPPVAEQVVLI